MPRGASVTWPVFMRSRSRTRMDRRFADTESGASPGKNFSTGSSTENFPSATASPTAVDVKLLLSEYNTCGVRAPYGDHQPSATTRPWRTIMTLFIASIAESAALTKARTALDDIPSRSGVLRGSAVPVWPERRAPKTRQRATTWRLCNQDRPIPNRFLSHTVERGVDVGHR